MCALMCLDDAVKICTDVHLPQAKKKAEEEKAAKEKIEREAAEKEAAAKAELAASQKANDKVC